MNTVTLARQSARQLANDVITKAKMFQTLLNWDHDVNPTPLDDLAANIMLHVQRHMGWKLLRVSFKGTVMTIEQPHDILLVLDLSTGMEHYGRARQCGFTVLDIRDMRECVTAHMH